MRPNTQLVGRADHSGDHCWKESEAMQWPGINDFFTESVVESLETIILIAKLLHKEPEMGRKPYRKNDAKLNRENVGADSLDGLVAKMAMWVCVSKIDFCCNSFEYMLSDCNFN